MAIFGRPDNFRGMMGGYGGGTFGLDGEQVTPVNVGAGFPIGQQQTISEPFVYGAGGRRMSPEDIALQREIAENQRLAGADFSPVGSVWEGLGRIGQGVMSGIGQRDVRRASEVNAAESDAVLQALLSGEGGLDPVMAALANPNISEQVRGLAELEYKRRNPAAPKMSEFERALQASGVIPGSPEWAQAMQTKVSNTLDPWTNLVVGGNSVSGRQSAVQQALQRGGGPVSGAAQTTPPPAAVAELQRNPSSAAQFDEIFGAGASQQYLRGPASAPGGFPGS